MTAAPMPDSRSCSRRNSRMSNRYALKVQSFHPRQTRCWQSATCSAAGPRCSLLARDQLAGFGLTLHLASDAIMDADFRNVGAYMWACRHGLGIVEDRAGRALNFRQSLNWMAWSSRGDVAQSWRTGPTAPHLPTDLSGHIYRPVDLDDPGTVARAVHGWAADDLALAPA